MRIGTKIAIERITRRKALNTNGTLLANQFGKNETTISRWCSNSAQPSLEVLVRLLLFLMSAQKIYLCNYGKCFTTIY